MANWDLEDIKLGHIYYKKKNNYAYKIIQYNVKSNNIVLLCVQERSVNHYARISLSLSTFKFQFKPKLAILLKKL